GLKTRHVALDKLLRRHVFARGRLHHFLAMLVSARHEENIVAVEALEARNRVRGDKLVSMADMRRAIRIGNRGCDEVTRAGHAILCGSVIGDAGRELASPARRLKVAKTKGLRS